jgi:hypothetical protein
MRIAIQRLLFAPAVLTMLSASIAIQAADFKPARFGTGPESFLANLACPEPRKSDSGGTVFCEARVRTDGRTNISESFCFVPNGLDYKLRAYVFEADQTVDKAVFVPAEVDGENVEVIMPMRVVFTWDNGTCSAAAIPNWGEEGFTTDFKYFAPQEIIQDGRSWWDKVPPLRWSYRGTGIIFAVSVQVSEGGVASDARLEANNFGVPPEIQASLRFITTASFIPAFYEGKPTSMRYYSVLWTQ